MATILAHITVKPGSEERFFEIFDEPQLALPCQQARNQKRDGDVAADDLKVDIVGVFPNGAAQEEEQREHDCEREPEFTSRKEPGGVIHVLNF